MASILHIEYRRWCAEPPKAMKDAKSDIEVRNSELLNKMRTVVTLV